jgi:hypothetical protein
MPPLWNPAAGFVTIPDPEPEAPAPPKTPRPRLPAPPGESKAWTSGPADGDDYSDDHYRAAQERRQRAYTDRSETVLIYRFEKPCGHGPYSSDKGVRRFMKTRHFWEDCCPPPPAINPGLDVCGFVGLAEALAWFGDLLEIMRDAGFRLHLYRVPSVHVGPADGRRRPRPRPGRMRRGRTRGSKSCGSRASPTTGTRSGWQTRLTGSGTNCAAR